MWFEFYERVDAKIKIKVPNKMEDFEGNLVGKF